MKHVPIFLVLMNVAAFAAEKIPLPTAHTTRNIEGWTVRVDNRLLHGYNERLAKCVHIPEVADFLEPAGMHSQPWVVLHELAHAFHHQVIGFEDARVSAAWKKFRVSGKYKSVLTVSGNMREHYGLTDPKEFFAEMTECYFGSNDFYPFVSGESKQAEPEAFVLFAEIWGPLPGSAPRSKEN